MSNQVIGFHYTLTNKEGQLIDSSKELGPLYFFVGNGEMIPALEAELVQLNTGDKKVIELESKDAYGDIITDLQITVARTQFPADLEVKVGAQFQVNEEPEAPIFTVVAIEGEDIMIDGNHPMAGLDLVFDVEVVDKREATEQELTEGFPN